MDKEKSTVKDLIAFPQNVPNIKELEKKYALG